MAVDALGPERVHCVMMPYRYTSNESLRDAAQCAKALGVDYDTLPIEPAVAASRKALEPMFAGTQARHHRGEHAGARARHHPDGASPTSSAAWSSPPATSREMSVGYATLYGDMNGGFNPIKDLYKMEVYRLARWRNAHVPKGGRGRRGRHPREHPDQGADGGAARRTRPTRIRCRPTRRSTTSSHALVEKEMPLADIVARGHAPETVKKIERLLYLAEYKRRQAPPGVKISSRNFGRDRRYPIVNKFREPL